MLAMLRSYIVPLLLILSLSSILIGCTPQEKADAQIALQDALSSLVQNRALTEQFVRDVKATGDPSDPAYLQALESYQNARETYNRFLDDVESGNKAPHMRSLRGRSSVDVQNATADFLADATAVLKPNTNTRHIPFQRAVVIPDNLSTAINRIPRKIRERALDHLDPQVRWRSWSDL